MGKKLSDGKLRIITAVILLPIVGFLLFYARVWSYFLAEIIILLFAGIGVYELLKAFSKTWHVPKSLELEAGGEPIDINEHKEVIGGKPFIRPMWGQVAITFALMYPAAIFFNEAGILLTAILGMMLVFASLIFTKNYGLKDAMTSCFGIIYPMAIIMLAVPMQRAHTGAIALFLVLFVSVLTDTFAYIVGRAIGRHKLCPHVSPKKTIEGAIGGIFGGLLGATVVFLMDHFNALRVFSSAESIYYGGYNLLPNSPVGIVVMVYLLVGLFGAIFNQFGDLAASYIKRKLNIKDFGSIFPGHGGVMDRIDGIMFVIPVVYIVFTIVNSVR